MLEEISKFSKMPGHGQLVGLAVMSHGDDRGNISGSDGLSVCSVQQLVDSLCQPKLELCTKVVDQHFNFFLH